MYKKICLVFILLVCTFRALASGPDGETTTRYTFHFRVGESVLDMSFGDNARTADSLFRCISVLGGKADLRRIHLYSGASVEGTARRNARLSERRLEALRSFMQEKFELPDSMFVTTSVGSDWSGLQTLVEKSDMPYKDEVLRILRMPEYVVRDGVVIDGRKARLMTLNGGRVWWYMEDHLFPALRESTVLKIEFDLRPGVDVASLGIPVVVNTIRTDTVRVHTHTVDTVQVQKVEKTIVVYDTVRVSSVIADTLYKPSCKSRPYPFILAVKSNLLYDATSTINVGVEWRISDRWSVEVSGNYNPWTFSNNRKMKHWLIQPEARRWFCEPFLGSFLGFHMHGGEFNFGGMLPWGFKNGKMFGSIDSPALRGHRYEGWIVGAGVSYGYHMSLARRWGLEFELGIGYSYLKYDKYRCEKCGDRLGHDKVHYFGPTKAAVTLVYLIK